MPDRPYTRLPRLGDRKDLRIEVTPSAVSSYRQTRRATTGVVLSTSEAREELEDVLRESSVKYSVGESMSVRGRLRRLGVDVQSDLTRLAPDHVCCHLAQVRRYSDDNGTRARIGGGALAVRTVYEPVGAGRRKAGYVRIVRRGTAEYRPVAEEDGAKASPWGPMPEHVRAIALRDESFTTWLSRFGVRL